MRWRGKFCTTTKAVDTWGYYIGGMMPDPSSPDGPDMPRANSYFCCDFLKQHMDLEHSSCLDQFECPNNPAQEASITSWQALMQRLISLPCSFSQANLFLPT